jgi:hypothetical protein
MCTIADNYTGFVDGLLWLIFEDKTLQVIYYVGEVSLAKATFVTCASIIFTSLFNRVLCYILHQHEIKIPLGEKCEGSPSLGD